MSAQLFLVDSSASLDALVRTPPSGQWTAVVDLQEQDVMPALSRLANLTHVAGIAVRHTDKAAVQAAARDLGSGGALTAGPKKPNSGVDIYGAAMPVWNPRGSDGPGPAFANFRAMVVLLSEADFKTAADWARHNRDTGYSQPMRAGQYNYPMNSANQNAYSCLLHRKCQPVGSNSVWGSFRPLSTYNSTDQQKYVMLAVPITSTTLFHQFYAPGASVVGGASAALLAAVEALSRATDRGTTGIAPDWQIVFGFFVGEEYDTMGSRRFVDDVHDFVCYQRSWNSSNRAGYYCYNPPEQFGNITTLKLEHFQYVIGIDQVGLQEVGEPSGTWVHWDDPQHRGQSFPATHSQRLRDLLVAGGGTEATGADFVGRMPPGPAQSFVGHPVNANRTDIGAAVVTGYPGPWTNRFWGSIHDTANLQDVTPRINSTLVANAAQAVVSAVWSLIRASPTAPLPASVNTTLVSELVSCLSEDANCDQILSYWSDSAQQSYKAACGQPCTPNTYPGVIGDWDRASKFTLWAHQYLIKVLDQTPRDNLTPCNAAGSLLSICKSSAPNYTAPQTYCIRRSAIAPPGSSPPADWNEGYSGACMRAPVFFHAAYSPGIVHTTANVSGTWGVLVNTTHPVWAESNWGSKWGTRLFTTDSTTHEAMLLVSGVLTTLIAFGVMVAFNRFLLPKLKRD